jgi:glycopeptide antibiotics resistance protein
MLKAKSSKFEAKKNVQLRASSSFFLVAAYLFFLGWVWFWHPARQSASHKARIAHFIPFQNTSQSFVNAYHATQYERHYQVSFARNFFGNILLFVPLGFF